MRLVCWFMSFMIVVSSTQSAYAASPAGWTASPSDTIMAGATATVTAFKGAGASAMKATISYKPTALAVGKEIVKGGGLLAVAYAMSQLLDAGVDWVLDPANNSVKYSVPVSDSGSLGQYRWFYKNGTVTTYASSAEAACLIPPYSWAVVTGVYRMTSENVAQCQIKANSGGALSYNHSVTREINPAYDPAAPTTEEKYLPISTVASQVISNAEAGHADSQDFVKAVAVGGVNAGDMDIPLDSVAEPATDTPTDTPADPAKPYDDSGILDLLKKLVAAMVGLWASFGEFVGFMDSDLPPEKSQSETAVDVEPPAVPTKSASEFDVDYVSFGGSCPAMPSANISIMGINAPLSFDMTPLCNLAVSIRPAVLAIAYFVGLGVVASAIRET